MKVIFTDNVAGVAFKGDSKNVKPGFFRNYLLPYKKAVLATEPLLRRWEEQKKRMLIAKEQLHAKIQEMQRRLAGVKVKIEKKVTKKGTLYGGVKPADIVKAILEGFSIEIPEEAVAITTPIKSVGTYEVKLNLGAGMETIVPIEVVEKMSG